MRIETLAALLLDNGLPTTITDDPDIFDGDPYLVVPGVDIPDISIQLAGELLFVYEGGRCHEFNVSQVREVVALVNGVVRSATGE